MKIPEMKVVYNHRSNVLEQDPYSYTIQEVAEPNLFRSIYPYHEVPKLPFNYRTVPQDMPKEIFLTDTTFRDGQQSRAPYSVQQIVDLFDFLHRLSGPKGIIRQTEFFVYSDRDKEALYKCLERGYKYPEVTTWIRASINDFKLVRDLGIKETGILVSCSDYHIFKKLNMTRHEALEHYMRVVHDALDVGLRPRCHFEDLTRADFYGFVVPFASALMELGKQTGVPIKIRACDTMGYGVPFVGVAPPRSVPGLVYGLRHYANVPSLLLEWHGHNDFYKGVANATTAWLYGASAVNCSLLGIGERTGNVPLEAMVIEYAQLRGSFDGMDPRVITEIAEYYELEIGHSVPPMTPFVGRNFNVTRAGIHADGLMKDEEIYNIFDTGKILNRPIVAAVSNTSGLAGVAYWINSYFRLPKEERVSKKDEVVVKVKELVDAEFSGGREVVISDDEMLAMVEQFAPGKYVRLKK